MGQAAGALALALLTGCATYEQQTQQFTSSTKTGSFASAVIQIDQQAAKSTGSKDELVFRLEQGATLLTAAMADPTMVPDIRPAPVAAKKGEAPPAPLPEPTAEEVHKHYLTRSVAAFDAAEAKVNAWEEQAKVKVGAELGAAMTNQANLPYRGRAYDKVMMNTYKAVGYLALGDKDKARVELNRSLQRQRDAVAANEKRIASAQEEAELARTGQLKDEKGKSASYDPDKARADGITVPLFHNAASRLPDWTPKNSSAPFANPGPTDIYAFDGYPGGYPGGVSGVETYCLTPSGCSSSNDTERQGGQ